jgi:hypothetical protein
VIFKEDEFDKYEDAAPSYVVPLKPVAVEDVTPNIAAPNFAVPLAWAEPEPEGTFHICKFYGNYSWLFSSYLYFIIG